MEFKLTIGAEPELLKALQNIAAAFSGSTTSPKKTKEKAETVVTTTTTNGHTEETATAPVVEQTAENTVIETDITIEMIRAITVEKSKAGHREAVKKALSSFKVDKVGELPESEYAAYYEKVKAI